MLKLKSSRSKLITFLEERDWLIYNSFSSLSKTLFIEANELLMGLIPEVNLPKVKEEVGDVYSALLQIDLLKEKYGYSLYTLDDLKALADKEESGSANSFAKRLVSKSSELLLEEDPATYFSKANECLTYLFKICAFFNLDIDTCLIEKLILTASHYPVEKSKGKATKYDKL